MTVDQPSVVPYDLGGKWEPNVSSPRVIAERGCAAIVVPPHFADPDRRLVVLRVSECLCVWLDGLNDEGRGAHRLWETGLRDCVWAGEVLNSDWIAERRRRVQATWSWPRPFDAAQFDEFHHWILLFKEAMVECVGREIALVRRHPPIKAS